MKLKKSALIKILLVSFLLIVLIKALGAPNTPTLSVPDDAQAGDLVGLNACTFTNQDVEYASECGTQIVPENRSNPNSRLIALPVTRLKTASNNPSEPIFWFEGGPGSENVISYPLDGLTNNHDFVMVGYRGVEGQVILECPNIERAFKNAPGTLLSPESLATYTSAASQCAKQLESEGIDLAGYTLTETVDDIEAVRTALGYDKINLYGESYGTRLQQIYLWRYPESINRVIMVAVNPPGHFLWDPAVTDAQIANYAELCTKDTNCNARTNDLVATMREVLEKIPDSWMGITLDKDVIKLLTYFMFVESIQSPGSLVPLSGPAAVDLWLDAAEGDYSGIALASLSKNLFLPSLFKSGHRYSMGGSVEDYRNNSLDYETFLNPPNALIGAPLSRLFHEITKGWPTHTIDEEYFKVQSSEVETLLVNGNIDFSTPPQYGKEELLPHLTNAELVILEDIGHTESVWLSQPEARAHLVTTFFDKGEVDASLYKHQPVNFIVNQGWDDLMRILIIIIAAVIVLIITLIWFIIYQIRHRKTKSNKTKKLQTSFTPQSTSDSQKIE